MRAGKMWRTMDAREHEGDEEDGQLRERDVAVQWAFNRYIHSTRASIYERNKSNVLETNILFANSYIPAKSTPTHNPFRRNIHTIRNLYFLPRPRNQLRPDHLRQPSNIRRSALLQPPTLVTGGRREEAPADVGNENANAIRRRQTCVSGEVVCESSD